jgi:hypothetical protein
LASSIPVRLLELCLMPSDSIASEYDLHIFSSLLQNMVVPVSEASCLPNIVVFGTKGLQFYGRLFLLVSQPGAGDVSTLSMKGFKANLRGWKYYYCSHKAPKYQHDHRAVILRSVSLRARREYGDPVELWCPMICEPLRHGSNWQTIKGNSSWSDSVAS